MAQVRWGVDDPLDASVVHAGNGLLGMLLLGMLAKPELVAGLTGRQCGGFVYGAIGWTQLGMQILGEQHYTVLLWLCCVMA